MERWEATYLGSRIVGATQSVEAYSVLESLDLVSWQSGGCSLLAAALERLLGAAPWDLVRMDGVTDHVVARLGSYYFDADGAYTALEMREKHEELEGHRVELVAATQVTFVCPPVWVKTLANILEHYGVD